MYQQHGILSNERINEVQEETYENMIFLAQSGNDEALNWLLEEHTGFIHSIVSKIIDRNDNYYQDLVQEAYMAFIRAIKGFDMSYQVKLITYAHKVIRNELYRIMRKIHKEIESEVSLDKVHPNFETALLDRIPHNENPEKIYYALSKTRFLHRYLNQLPKDTKKMIMLYYGFYDSKYTYQEIGAMYKLTKSSIKKRIDRGLDKLRSLMLSSVDKEFWWTVTN
jgi:RNA polymerase sigma factor (sigma-70 family)